MIESGMREERGGPGKKDGEPAQNTTPPTPENKPAATEPGRDPKDAFQGATLQTSKAKDKAEESSKKTDEEKTLMGRLLHIASSMGKAACDIGYMCVEVPKTLFVASPTSFVASSLANVTAGAQALALTWTSAVFGAMVLEHGALAPEYLAPCVVVLGALHFGGRWLESVNDYQAVAGRVDTRRHFALRLIHGILGQKLAQLGDEKFTQSASLAQTNGWVPFNLGNFYFPILKQASSLAFLGSAIVLEAPWVVIGCAVGMTIPSILTTMISTHLSNSDEATYAKSNRKGWRITEYLTSVDYLRGLKIDGVAPSLQKRRDEFLNPGLDGEKRRGRVSFWLDTAGAVVFGGCLATSLYEIGSVALSGGMSGTKALLLSAVVLQVSQAVSGVVSSLVRLRLAAPFVRAIRTLEDMIENPPPLEANCLDQVAAPGLKLNGATVTRAGQELPLLRDVSATLRGGTVTALFGPQGCGKTTLLDILAGLAAPERHEQIQVVAGEEVYNLTQIHPHEWIRCIAYCSQHPQIYSTLTLRQNIIVDSNENLETSQADNERIQKLLSFIGKPQWVSKLDIPIGSADDEQGFSGGEKQLIAFARALFKKPKLLFLDEAFTNLPQKLTEELICGIRNLGEVIGWQPTVIMVSHDSRQSLYADQIILLSAESRTVLGVGTHRQLSESFDEYRREAEALRGPIKSAVND